MATLAQVRTKADNWLTARYPAVVARQDAYFAAHGRYWQGLRTHTFDITYTTATNNSTYNGEVADNLEGKPSDLAESWLDAFPAFASIEIPAVFVMDVYRNRNGWGWVLTVRARHNGNLYARSHNGAGNETWRTIGWHQVAED